MIREQQEWKGAASAAPLIVFMTCIRFSSVSTTTRSVAVEIGSIGERCFASNSRTPNR
jgi:hypothetical protein